MSQSIIDKIKIAGWFRAIAREIEKKVSNWLPAERPEIESRIAKYRATATRLEEEAQAIINDQLSMNSKGVSC